MAPRTWSFYFFTLPSSACWLCSLAGSPHGPNMAATAPDIIARDERSNRKRDSVCVCVCVYSVRKPFSWAPANVHSCLIGQWMCLNQSQAEDGITTVISASHDSNPRAHGCGGKGGYPNKNEFCCQGRGEYLLWHSRSTKTLTLERARCVQGLDRMRREEQAMVWGGRPRSRGP